VARRAVDQPPAVALHARGAAAKPVFNEAEQMERLVAEVVPELS